MSHRHHVVLLGDSIFDNAAYVSGGPDVVRQLGAILPDGSAASLLAVDGAVTEDVSRQFSRLPSDATMLVLSVGGNDALGEAHLLQQPVPSVAAAVSILRQAQQCFAKRYRSLLDQLCASGVPAAVCTIYDANFPAPEGPVIISALSLFNDVITRAAFSRGLPLIDLRLICDEPADYANPIEPSVQGGAKIAAAIAALALDGSRGRPFVIAGA